MIPHETLVVHEIPRWIVRKSPYFPHKLAPAPPRWVFGIEQFGLRGVRILTTHTRHTTRSYPMGMRQKLALSMAMAAKALAEDQSKERLQVQMDQARYKLANWIAPKGKLIRWSGLGGANPPTVIALSGDGHHTIT